MTTLDQVQGCLLGLALGDALGAPYEGGILERLLWRAIGVNSRGEMRWTDDTQMTVDLIESFLTQGRVDPDHLALRFAGSYHWSRGYGPAAAKILKRIAKGTDWRTANRSVYKDGSYGNGAAMRAPILGLIFAGQPDQLTENARLSAIVTHAHPLGIEGVITLAFVAESVARNCNNPETILNASNQCRLPEFRSRLEIALKWLESEQEIPAKEVSRRMGCGIAAHESCVTAVYSALRFRCRPFPEMMEFIISIGGDVDTIGAMAGAIWGLINGYSQLPTSSVARLEQHEDLASLAEALYRRIIN